MSILDRILLLIKMKGWSTREFERRLNVSTGTVNGWKSRQSVPEKQIFLIAIILDTTESYLRGETDDPRPNDKKIDALYEHQISPTKARLLKEVENMSDEKAIAALKYIRFLKQERTP